jgi:hypothetical protein
LVEGGILNDQFAPVSHLPLERLIQKFVSVASADLPVRTQLATSKMPINQNPVDFIDTAP